MWKLNSSRGRFFRDFPYKNQPSSDAVAGILGVGQNNQGQGNIAELDRLMQSFEYIEGINSSEGVFCGLIPKGDKWTKITGGSLAGSYRFAKADDAALIAIDLRYLEMAAAGYDAICLFPKFLEHTRALSKMDGNTLLRTSRASMFKYVGIDYPELTRDYVDESVLFSMPRSMKTWAHVPKAALYFVMGHELDHLFRPDNRNRRNSQDIKARIVKSREMIGPLFPERNQEKHLDEVLADHGAVEFVGTAASKAGFDLETVMTGSFLSLATVAFDNWFVNRSEPAPSHPSAFSRTHGLRLVWSAYLSEQNSLGWTNSPQPTEEALLRVAHSFVFTEWVAGLYEAHRRGVDGALDDLNLTYGVFCRAIGL